MRIRALKGGETVEVQWVFGATSHHLRPDQRLQRGVLKWSFSLPGRGELKRNLRLLKVGTIGDQAEACHSRPPVSCPVQVNVGYPAVHPPSTMSDDPVTSAEASDAKNSTAPIISSTFPVRPSLILFSIQARLSGFSNVGLVRSVRMKVGQIVFTRMPAWPHSIAMDLVKPSTACFVAA